jgi:hypothetical protein
MQRKPLRRGAFLLILGLIILQLGELAIMHQTVLMGQVLDLLSNNVSSLEFLGILTQLLGVALIVAGLTSLIDGIVTIKLENEIHNSEYRILAGIEEKISKAMAQKMILSSQTHLATKTCKFCAAQLTTEDVFCPSCGKSQL